jgi:hypothetical protein
MKKWREAELKHGRVAMLAAVGMTIQEQFHPFFGLGDVDVVSELGERREREREGPTIAKHGPVGGEVKRRRRWLTCAVSLCSLCVGRRVPALPGGGGGGAPVRGAAGVRHRLH